MRKEYKVGGFSFCVNIDDGIGIPEHMQAFEGLSEKACMPGDFYQYDIHMVDQLPEIEGNLLTRREDIQIYKNGELESRLIGRLGVPGYYACYQEMDDKHAAVSVISEYKDFMHHDTIFNSLLALERRMIARDGLILHCAYMKYQGQAILFSAPSETGKSTQADLWEKYRGSNTVNGDRALLQKVDGRWQAHGWPVCGSSGICHNESVPIKAIVMLSQAKANSAWPLRAMQAWSQVYSQITINRWNNGAHSYAMSLIEDLISQVPVYHLACNISEEAVACLESVLYLKKD